MARPRKASNVHKLNGTYKTHPERENKNEPESPALKDGPPKYFNAMQKRYWKDLINRVPAGILTQADYYVVATCATLLAEMEENEGTMRADKLTKLIGTLDKLGMTPSGRAGLKVEKPKKNEFDDF